MFKDRKDAGQQLAKHLLKYNAEDPVVLAIPRGGVEIGRQVADTLDAELSIIVSRKLPFPDNPESGFGAIAEDDSTYLSRRFVYGLPEQQIERIMEEQRRVIQERIATLRHNQPLPPLQHRCVILVDDGIAMGSTMKASIRLVKKQKPRKLIVAAPVSSAHVAQDLEQIVDAVIIVEKPLNFRAVAQVYENWYDVSDAEAIYILHESMNSS